MNYNYYDNIMLVIASRGEISDFFINYYWKPFIEYVKNDDELKIILIYGNSDISELKLPQENVLQFYDIDEKLDSGCLLKTIKAFEFIKENYEYNKIIKTNLFSFFIYDSLVEHLRTINNIQVYGGYLENYNDIEFVSGDGIIFSKSIIEIILQHKKIINYNENDDVSFGILLSKLQKKNIQDMT